MPAFRILQLILIGALCLGFLSLHGTLGATVYVDPHCPFVIEPDHHASASLLHKVSVLCRSRDLRACADDALPAPS